MLANRNREVEIDERRRKKIGNRLLLHYKIRKLEALDNLTVGCLFWFRIINRKNKRS